MRKLSTRERILLACLGVVAVISAYVLLFYFPMEQQTRNLQERIAQSQELLTQLTAKLEEQKRMEHSIDQQANQPDPVPYMPAYDNQQAVMMELNDILAGCREYSLSFQGDQAEENVFCRKVTLPFVCADYPTAKEVLNRLSNSVLRCQLNDVQISQQSDGAVRVNVSMIFFEYKAA